MDMRHSTPGQERRWPIGALARGARSPGVPVPTTADEVLEEHERQRRRRLVRILTLGLMIPSLLLIPSALFPKFILGSLLSLLIVLAVLLQWVAAVIGWIGADSIRRALAIAARVDEVGAANARISAQAREIEVQRLRLQEGITRIQQVAAAIARGNLDARVRVDQAELLPMATSLNLLLDRLTRLTREQSDRAQIEAAAHELAMAMRQMRAGIPVGTLNYTGTAFDEVLIEFAALRSLQTARPSLAPPSRPTPPPGTQPREPRNANSWPPLHQSEANGQPPGSPDAAWPQC